MKILLFLFLLGCSVQNGVHQPITVKQPSKVNVESTCLGCHRVSGYNPQVEKIPWIAGQNQEYIIKQLLLFKSNQRIDTSNTMNNIAKSLTEEDIQKTAEYFSNQSVSTKNNPQLLNTIFKRGQALALNFCVSCHMNPEYENKTTFYLIPFINGQSKMYLIEQLRMYKEKTRLNPLMEEYTKNLSLTDIEAVSAFFSLSK